jgi:hypothetical protein
LTERLAQMDESRQAQSHMIRRELIATKYAMELMQRQDDYMQRRRLEDDNRSASDCEMSFFEEVTQ